MNAAYSSRGLVTRARRGLAGLLPRTRLRWLGASLAALFLAALVADVAHRAAVDHVVCSEHGELTHVESAPGAVASDVACADAYDGPRATSSTEGEPAHEHCALGAVRRDTSDVVLPEALVRLAPPAPRIADPILARALPAHVALGAAWARGPPSRA